MNKNNQSLHTQVTKNKEEKKERKKSIEKAIQKLVKQYFSTIDKNDHQSQLHQELISRVERELIASVLAKTDNNQSQTAKILGISRTTLRKKMANFDI